VPPMEPEVRVAAAVDHESKHQTIPKCHHLHHTMHSGQPCVHVAQPHVQAAAQPHVCWCLHVEVNEQGCCLRGEPAVIFGVIPVYVRPAAAAAAHEHRSASESLSKDTFPGAP
jgi:hypothetical protein